VRFTGGMVLAMGLATLPLLPRGSHAQEVPQLSWGAIRGTIYDSLLHSPLTGAHVALVGGARATLTDEHGSFTLDSVPAGPQIVTFSRGDLDSIGLSSFVARAVVAPNAVTSLSLAVPSFDTFWRAACGAATSRASEDSGLVFGTVTDAETRHRLAGARVRIGWVAVRTLPRHRWVIEHPSRDVLTDSTGSFYVCGTPVEYLLTARAFAGRFASGTAEPLVDIRGIARRDLSVSREALPGSDSTEPGGLRGLATIVGTVRGERGGLLTGTIASVDDVDGTVVADSTGRFVLRSLPSGTQMLMVRRIGYFAHREAVDLRNRDTVRVDVVLEEATMLDTIRVTAAPALAPVLEEIDMRRRSGFGYLLGLSAIRQRPSVMSLFEGWPSLDVRGSGLNFTLWFRFSYSLHGAVYCRAHVYLDGFLADEEQLANTMQRQIVVIEVYPRQTAGLGRYTSMDNCGVVLVWTENARAR